MSGVCACAHRNECVARDRTGHVCMCPNVSSDSSGGMSVHGLIPEQVYVCVLWGGSRKVWESLSACAQACHPTGMRTWETCPPGADGHCARVCVCVCVCAAQSTNEDLETGEGIHPLAEREGGQGQRLKWTSGQSQTVRHALCRRGQGWPPWGCYAPQGPLGVANPGPPKVFLAMERKGCRYLIHLVG